MKADNRDISFKKGWEKRRLGDIGKVITGSTPSTKDKDNYSSDDYCFIKPSDIVKDGISNLYDSEFHISQKGFDISRQLPVGSVLTTCIGIVGKVAILYTPAICNQQINAIIPSNIISSKFLAYSILGIRNILETIANAPVVPIINKKDFSNIKISVPPLAEQERIVSELDLLSEIIDKQKAQLKELDNLAQSIFYDMFGDPVENKKGWEVRTLKDIFSLKAGKAIKASELSTQMGETLYPCYGGNGIRGYIAKNSHNGIYNIIGRQGALCGNITLAKGLFYATEHAVVVTPLVKLAPQWIFYTLTALNLNKYAKGVAQPGLSVSVINDVDIPVPHIDLQNSFAEKIERIEKQKEAITRSIADTQQLFDYTMDKYFG